MQAVLGHRLRGARQQDVAQLLKELQHRVPVLA